MNIENIVDLIIKNIDTFDLKHDVSEKFTSISCEFDTESRGVKGKYICFTRNLAYGLCTMYICFNDKNKYCYICPTNEYIRLENAFHSSKSAIYDIECVCHDLKKYVKHVEKIKRIEKQLEKNMEKQFN